MTHTGGVDTQQAHGPGERAEPEEPDSPAVHTTAGDGGFAVRRVVRPPREEPTRRVVSRDETDVGWGDGPSVRDDDWYRRERPPHHG